VDETTDKEKAGNQIACLDLYSLIFRLTVYIAKTLSNLTACLSEEQALQLRRRTFNIFMGS
jgi:hypothetical protein